VTPVARDELDAQPQPNGQVSPLRRKLPRVAHQHGVAGRQRVDQRRFPGAGTRRGIHHDRPCRLENALQPRADLFHHRCEGRSAVIDRRPRHRTQDPIGNVGWTGDLKEMPPAV
jgi:hypothetical protein